MQEDLPTPGEQSLKYERKVALPNLNKCFEIVHEEKSLLAGPTGIHNSYLLGGGGVQGSKSLCLPSAFLSSRLSAIHTSLLYTQGFKKNKQKCDNNHGIKVQHFLETPGATMSGWQAQELASLGQGRGDCSLQPREPRQHGSWRPGAGLVEREKRVGQRAGGQWGKKDAWEDEAGQGVASR